MTVLVDDNAAVPELLVGRTGAAAVAVVVLVATGSQVDEPQARSVGQQPPPRLAGHD